MKGMVKLALPMLAAAVVFGGPLRAQAIELKTGEPFPALELPRLSDGRLVGLKDFRGRKVVLHVWASW